MRKLLSIVMALVPMALWAQFAPPAGVAGTTAIHADSSAFVAWATGCAIERGPQNIARPANGLASYGSDTDALGKADNMVASLGDGGIAVLTFNSPIFNGEGPDFAVFENGFSYDTDPSLYFLELAFVEVSSDGENYFRFPAISAVQTEDQVGSFDGLKPEWVHNFAGKYEAFYGTPFDLDDLEDNALLDKNKITHVRLVDVVGSIKPEYATVDSEGNVVNDPWPTAFNSCGFDLDAVGVIHDLAHNDVAENEANNVDLYPNPVSNRLQIKAEGLQSVEVFNMTGRLLLTSTSASIDMSVLEDGLYLVRVVCEGGLATKRIVKQ